MTLFDQYGIHDVVDATFYSIHKKSDGSGELYYVPALHLDTLKISTTEKTAENTWAQGGKGNLRLVSWDYGKTINISIEDALCSPASLGMCWNGILSADWKDGKIDYQTGVCECCNPFTVLQRTEKAFYPRSNRTPVSKLLPKIKADVVDDQFDLLKISSVVDGTDIRGFGSVRNKTYKWKMAVESAVKSIAVVPDRFFDVKGNAYTIDWDRKVSVHSLPDYENYRDAVIYRINNRGKFQVPPLAKIIYDAAMEDQGTLVEQKLEKTVEVAQAPIITLAKLLKDLDYTVYENGVILKDDTYYVPLRNLDTQIQATRTDSSDKISYKYETTEILYKIKSDSELEKKLKNISLIELEEDVGTTLRNYLWNHKVDVLKNDSGTEIVNKADATYKIKDADYLAIIVDNNNNYIPLVGVAVSIDDASLGYTSEENAVSSEPAAKKVVWFDPCPDVDVSQFKGIDMWIRFQSINEMIYFMITKYKDNIVDIKAATIRTEPDWAVDKKQTDVVPNSGLESEKVRGKLWSYINPRTMQPYDDDYWFHQGEPYYIQSLTLAPESKKIKGHKIVVRADQFPGMYMMIGETHIRSRDTGEDQDMQIKIPFCKVKSDHTLTLAADGDATVFNLDLEVASPPAGNMMEINVYESRTKMVEGENGCFYAVDGSSEVIVE